jgi:hypothetical protein
MFLFELPVDALQAIFSLVKTRHVIRLWLGGDLHAQSKMESGGAVQQLTFNMFCLGNRPLPSILSRFIRLSTLRAISILHVISNTSNKKLDNLSNLPGSIKDLHVPNFEFFARTVMTNPTHNPALFSNLRAIRLDDVAQSKALVHDLIWPRGLEEFFSSPPTFVIFPSPYLIYLQI